MRLCSTTELSDVLKYFQAMGIERLPLSVPEPGATGLEELLRQMGDCQGCGLATSRTKLVFGEGNPAAELMFIGEAPGRDEDRQGRPFVGKAGQLLDRLIAKMGLQRKEVYIANILKCRPPGNRDPEPDEVDACIRFLKKQIEVISPRVIITLGRIASHTLLDTKTPISRLRGTFHKIGDIPVMPTFHPAYLLHNPKDKKLVWEDAQQVLKLLGTPPAR